MENTIHVPSASPTHLRNRSEAGFTLIEVVVSMAVMVVVLAGLLALLQFNSKVAKAQVNVSEMQQSLRAVQADMVRLTRMAGRGGLPLREEPSAAFPGMLLPAGPAIAVQNDVPAGAPPLGGVGEATVRAETDILTVRGVFSTPLYQVSPADDGDVRGARAARAGSITVRSTSPTGVPQDLRALREAIANDLPEALLLVSAGSDEVRAVVELTGGDASSDSAVVVNFSLDGAHAAEYRNLSPRGEFPAGLRSVAMVGLVEEYRYYVRDVDPPRLSRARFYPATEVPYNGDANAHVDLADNIMDLQLALGIDRNGNGVLEDNDDDADDWLFNADNDEAAAWNGSQQPLFYLRITTLARTDRVDPSYVSPAIDRIEDRVYNEPAEPPDGNDRLDRSYRRRLLHTVVDLRNLS